jgi:hypothetical protein
VSDRTTGVSRYIRLNIDESCYYAPFLLAVQVDLLSDLEARVVVPLLRASALERPAGRLHRGSPWMGRAS